MLAPRLRGALLLSALLLAGACDKEPTGLGQGNQNVDLTCQAGKIASAPDVGTVAAGLAGSQICIGGGSTGAQYALVAFYGNPDSSLVATVNVTSQGATALFTPDIAVANRSPSSGGALFTHNGNGFREQFDMRLRTMARRSLEPRMAAARAFMQRSHGATFDVIPQTLTDGQIITLNANANDPCDNPIEVGARVVTQTSGTIIVADTSNPAGGFTDADYQAFATMFDTLINPLDVANFGQPTDIDHNGKILIFFTQEVNKLTPRGSQGVVGGFTFERDLFPVDSTAEFGPGCAGSNYGEMFYVMVPDPNGVVSDPRTKGAVDSLTPSTLAHEYQHLINAGRRLYVNNANSFEDVWLNEGLSHIAEELLYYRQSGLTPRLNINSRTITATATSVNIFNNDQADNFGRYAVFLGKPSQTSVYAGNDSLETRGATWNLLRYLADQHDTGPSDASTWQALVNTTLTGKQNLAHVFGSNIMTQIGDWATSVFSDDLPGVPPTFQEPSWDMREIFPHLSNTNTSFPLKVVPLGDSSPATLSIDAGGVAYLRFSVAPNTQATINWSGASGAPAPAGMQFTVVRSQ